MDEGGNYSVAAMINPNHDNPPDEVNYLNGDWPGDNRKEVAYQVEYPCTDVSVSLSKDSRVHPVPGFGVMFYAHVSRADDGPDGPVNVSVHATGAGTDRTYSIALSRGESETIKVVTGPLDVWTFEFTVSAWPVGMEDCSPGNNADSISFDVEQPYEPPKGDTDVGAGLTGGGGLYWYR